MTPQDILDAIAAEPTLQAMRDAGDMAGVAAALSGRHAVLVPRMLSERGVRDLPVLPRSRYALLTVLRDAEATTPAWLAPTLSAAGVPEADHAALADDLASAYRWITQEAGIDVASAGARAMLDIISAAVPESTAACAAAKALAERPEIVTWQEVKAALENE